MGTKTIKSVTYNVISTKRVDESGYFDVYISHQNKGLRVSSGTKKHKLKISFEGLKHYHLGSMHDSMPCAMILKKDYKIINQ